MSIIDNMNIYYVFHKPSFSQLDYNSTVFVKDGFSFSAFLFNVFWIFYKKMWIVGFVIFIVLMGVDFFILSKLHWLFLYPLIRVWFAFVLGYVGNDIFFWHLKIKGYNLEAVVLGRDILEANRSFWLKKEQEFSSNEKKE